MFACPLQLSTPVEDPTFAPTVSSGEECTLAAPYLDDGICHAALQDVLFFLSCDSVGPPLVLRNDQEQNARLLLSALDRVRPSLECREEAVPLLCLHLFGLCSTSNVSIHPTSAECENVRDNLCRMEWQIAKTLNYDIPDCSSFPDQQESCSGSDMESENENGECFWWVQTPPLHSVANSELTLALPHVSSVSLLLSTLCPGMNPIALAQALP